MAMRLAFIWTVVAIMAPVDVAAGCANDDKTTGKTATGAAGANDGAAGMGGRDAATASTGGPAGSGGAGSGKAGSSGGAGTGGMAADAGIDRRCGACAAGLSCKCCEGTDICVCSTSCETDSECTDPARPSCIGYIGRKFCARSGSFCISP
jgi:hypothetical protein